MAILNISIGKAWERINVMRLTKFQLDRKYLQAIYFSFIRPLFEYGYVVWSNCTLYKSNEPEKKKKRKKNMKPRA